MSRPVIAALPAPATAPAKAASPAGDTLARIGAAARGIAPSLPVKVSPWVALGGGLLELAGDLVRLGASSPAARLQRLRDIDPELQRIRTEREQAWTDRIAGGR